MKDVAKLRALCDQGIVHPDWVQKADGTTFCNFFVQYVALGMGYNKFTGLLANQMIDLMVKSPDWKKVSGIDFAAAALDGTLCVAGQKELGHGHVAVGYPSEMQFSGSLGRKVPILANVGKAPNGLKRASQCFPVYGGNEASYFILVQ